MRRRIWKAAKIAVLSLLGLVLLVIGGGLVYRACRHNQIAQATAINQATGIDEALFARIGGIEQFVVIRGKDRKNPVLLILHGGPGFAQSAIPRDFLLAGPETSERRVPRAADSTRPAAGHPVRSARFRKTPKGLSNGLVAILEWLT